MLAHETHDACVRAQMHGGRQGLLAHLAVLFHILVTLPGLGSRGHRGRG